MKKVLCCLLAMVASLFVFSNKVEAVDYNGDRGYIYTSTGTKFYFISEDENINSVSLMIGNMPAIEMSELANGVYYYAYNHNEGIDLKEKEYYYSVCYVDSTCKDVLDPFALTINEPGNRNIILDTNSFVVEGWENVYTKSVDYYRKAIYAIEADKFVEKLDLIPEEGVVINDSVFSMLVSNTSYGVQNTNFLNGYRYLEQSSVKYVEIGDLYDENN